MKTWTLQARLTAIVAAILLSACLLLTTNSLFAARAYYGDYAALLESGLVEVDPAWEEGAGPDDALASPIEFYREASQKFSAQSLLAMALIALLAVGSTYLATGQVLRPLKNLTASAGRIDGRHLDRRVPEAGAQGEVLALTRSFNGMLERLEESFLIQKRFAASAAHELKTPLAVIKSALQVLEMAPHPSEADYREFMADTGESLERIIKTVDGLLSLANPKEVPMDETVELRPVLDLAVRELSGRAEECGVTLSVGGQAPPVRGDADLLYRAFANLIENAVKYNHPGGAVTVTLGREGREVSVTVKDDGPGIPANALPHIFEPFYRADPSRSQQIPGSGLGLAVVRLIVERHGGEIQVQSRPGAGSAFKVLLKG
ncbi:cell wall metabolism sensor histidine kinase WalK [Anaerotruncus massiliensis (ex Togo et al. 2019)]|uniref:sensor histidine kinase n=1 Tax=Anaerotruncus TaxID=244127 RepID=UPI001FA830E0|nr:ATP-binding protein [Anaerotruncus massiliensis (ex Togo et al. 2019)]